MRASRAVGATCAVAAVVVAVLLGGAGPAGPGSDSGGPAAAGSGSSVAGTSITRGAPDAAPAAPAVPTGVGDGPQAGEAAAVPCPACAGGSPAPTLAGVDEVPGQPQAPATAEGAAVGASFARLPTGSRWVDGTRVGGWRSVYDGYGTTRVEAGEPPVLSQRPRAATSPDVTHGALAVTVQEHDDVDFTVRQRTVGQLRSPQPNAWEVPWALWAHTDDQHFYYLVLKPNGWELGKEDPAYPGAQRFLATGSSPTFAVGAWHTVRIRQTGDTIEAWGNGRLLTRFVDRERPYRRGHIGLYTEDAHVEHADLVLHRG